MTDPKQPEDDPASKALLERIGALPYAEPSPGFDARMRARLDAIDARRPWWQSVVEIFTLPRVSIGAAAAAASLLAFVVLSGPRYEAPAPGLASAEALDIAEDLELYENYELIEDLDVLDDLELIETLDDAG